MFGKEKSTWEELSGIFTAQEIYQQPATWAKTIAQIKNEKEALKKFMEPVLSDPDCDIVFTGAGTSEYVGNALYSYVNRYTGYHAKSYASTDLVETPENYLSRNKKTLLVNFGRSGNSPESVGSVQVADEVCKENVYHLFITCNKDGALAKAAATRDNAYDINLTPETDDQSFAMTSSFSNMMLAALLCFRLDDIDEFYAIGGEEYFSTGICLIEWGDLIKDALPSDYIRICFEKDDSDENVRELKIEVFGSKYDNLF